MEKLLKYSFFKELSLRKMLFLALVFGFLINNSEGGCCKCCSGGGKSKGKSNGKYEKRKSNEKITLKFTFGENGVTKVNIDEINEKKEIDKLAQENGGNGGDICLFKIDKSLAIKLFNKDIEIEIENKEDELSEKYLISCVQMAEKYKWGGGYYILYSSNCQSTNIKGLNYGLFDCSGFKDYNAFQRNITVMKLFACGSNVTDMSYMFMCCSSLEELDLSNFDTGKVTDMKCMFCECSSLKKIVFGNKFDTSKVTDMVSMFEECSSLGELNLSNFDTSKVTNMCNMFCGCSELKTIEGGNNFKISEECKADDIAKGASDEVIGFINKKKKQE